jgi:alpha-tubulin suppressor-like RCC1 family protein
VRARQPRHELGGSPCTGGAPNDSNAASDAPPDALPGCILQIDAYHRTSCALRSDHTVWCWGDNSLGLIGDGTTGNTRAQPTEVNGIIDATAIELGKNSAYALRANGDVVAWGTTPTASSAMGRLRVIRHPPPPCCTTSSSSPPATRTCVRATRPTRSTAAANWDAGNGGAIGDGTTNSRNSPTLVQGPFPALQITEAGRSTCAVKTDRTVWCWGQNKFGELGDGTQTEVHVPQQVQGITNAVAVYGSGHRACARLLGGTVTCWGEEPIAQRTVTTNAIDTPTTNAELTATRAFATASYHTCAIALDGSIECLGRNNEGQLGDGTMTDSTTFVPTPLACP